jgi:hypothetical protein
MAPLDPDPFAGTVRRRSPREPASMRCLAQRLRDQGALAGVIVKQAAGILW